MLTLANGAYTLALPDGTDLPVQLQRHLAYVQDSNGNRITAGYNTAGQLVTLTDSNGEYFDLTYNAQGHLATLTDSNGQTETYGYDPTGSVPDQLHRPFTARPPTPMSPARRTAEQRPGGDRLRR